MIQPVDDLQIQALFKKAQLSTDILSVLNCLHGGNNRTYQVENADGIFAVKKYFRGTNDKRDRLKSEFSFLTYANKAAPNFVPKAYCYDDENGLALYEFIVGKPLRSGEITEKEVSQAIEFFCLLNDPKEKANANFVPLASEAGFSIEEHLVSVGKRIRELQQAVAIKNEINNQEAKDVIELLVARWDEVVKDCTKQAALHQVDIKATLDAAERCISPSDFGFHNALCETEQKDRTNDIRFIDFEYAGWDDPARMANDFFSQLAVPIPSDYYDWFVEKTMSPFPNKESLIRRAKLLKAVYRIKWCCIALNIFIPMHMARRQFANPNLNMIDLRNSQLAKAGLILKTVEVSNYGSN